MLDIILKILVVIGITVLILFGIVIVLLLLVLFFPVSYRINGMKNVEEFSFKLKMYWLFGLLRAYYFLPEPGSFIVKLLCFTLYDSSEGTEESTQEKSMLSSKMTTGEQERKADLHNQASQEEEIGKETAQKQVIQNISQSGETKQETSTPEENRKRSKVLDIIFAKYEKIKYTILKIYDRIKHIFENIVFYRDLCCDEQTRGLLYHAIDRLKKILKNIRPRKLKADIVFGTGSPDTTGYILGIYGMFSPYLGKHVNITPDFTEAVLLGNFIAAGHITIFQVLYHSLRVIFDKRLKLLQNRINNHRVY